MSTKLAIAIDAYHNEIDYDNIERIAKEAIKKRFEGTAIHINTVATVSIREATKRWRVYYKTITYRRTRTILVSGNSMKEAIEAARADLSNIPDAGPVIRIEITE